MFTGIVEEIGTIEKIRHGAASAVLDIRARKVTEGTKTGDSIAVNGVCLTVVEINTGHFQADVMHETLERSALKLLLPGSRVNLERAMRADGRFGGHIVAGHVDGVGRITGIRRDDTAVWYSVTAQPGVMRYIVEKGSVAVDGISLTVAKVTATGFFVSVIPHTAGHTTLAEHREGDAVNLETDIIGKYVEKLLFPAAEQSEKRQNTGGLTMEFLSQNGF